MVFLCYLGAPPAVHVQSMITRRKSPWASLTSGGIAPQAGPWRMTVVVNGLGLFTIVNGDLMVM